LPLGLLILLIYLSKPTVSSSGHLLGHTLIKNPLNLLGSLGEPVCLKAVEYLTVHREGISSLPSMLPYLFTGPPSLLQEVKILWSLGK
jgi:hypothetical protein